MLVSVTSIVSFRPFGSIFGAKIEDQSHPSVGTMIRVKASAKVRALVAGALCVTHDSAAKQLPPSQERLGPLFADNSTFECFGRGGANWGVRRGCDRGK